MRNRIIALVLLILAATVVVGISVAKGAANTGSNLVNVSSCVARDNGIMIDGSTFLASSCRDAGYGLRQYTMTCVSNKQYRTDWKPCEITCADTDNGRDIFIRGIITAQTPKYGKVQVSDSCVDANHNRVTKGAYIDELVCLKDDPMYAYEHKYVKCEGGCVEGQCVQTVEKKCTDSDNGKDSAIKGTVVYYEGGVEKKTATDKCVDNKSLLEYFCNTFNYYEGMTVNCDGACQDGKCVKSVPAVNACAADKPNIYEPKNNTTVYDNAGYLNLKWTNLACAQKYQIEWEIGTTYLNDWVGQGKNTKEVTANNLSLLIGVDNTVRVRVRAFDANNNTSNWSNYHTYYIRKNKVDLAISQTATIGLAGSLQVSDGGTVSLTSANSLYGLVQPLFPVSYTYANKGGDEAKYVMVTYYFDNRQIMTRWVDKIGVGESANITEYLFLPERTGTHQLRISIDRLFASVEDNKKDNVMDFTVKLSGFLQ